MSNRLPYNKKTFDTGKYTKFEYALASYVFENSKYLFVKDMNKEACTRPGLALLIVITLKE
jgi:hypothetical protein